MIISSPLYSQNTGSYTFHFPEIKVITAESPVILSDIDFPISKREEAPPKVTNRIRKMILNRYFDAGLDSNESLIKVSDVYFNTVKVSNGEYSYYVVIFSSPPPVTSKIFAYNIPSDSVLETEIDYHIDAMYDISDKLTDSNLKKEFKMSAPDIELINSGSDAGRLKLRRLFHNGTDNSKETSVYKIEGKRLIRTYFNSEKP